MLATLVWIIFVAGTLLNLNALWRVDVRRLDLLDGILLGQAYYVIVPLAAFLIAGQSEAPDLLLVYRPYQDLATTFMLLSGLYLFPLLRLIVPRIHPASRDTSDPAMFGWVVLLFLGSGLAAFSLSGLGTGGHWQGNLEDAFRNPAFLPIKYAANVARNAVFAVLLYRVTSGRTSAWRAVLWGGAFAVIDLMTTFNRITAVYLVLLIVLLLKHRPVSLALAASASLAAFSSLSALWPAFRGLATVRGYSLASFAEAWDIAQRAGSAAPRTLDGSLNSVFESSNIVVLNWIVTNYGDADRPFLAFAMFARPLTLLVPGAVWPSRPENFGLSLGEQIAHLPSLALNSTLYGESYANFGWFWPLGLGAFVLLWHAAYRLIAPNARVVQMMGAFAGIAMWRFDASFIGSAALLTGALVCATWIVRTSHFKPYGRFYFYSFASLIPVVFLVGQLR